MILFDELLVNKIVLYLLNNEIFMFFSINKHFNKFLDNRHISKSIKDRIHPIVFNLIDNYCKKCNIPRVYLNFDYGISRCTHI